jgi:DNA-binding NarL/FixJ family response regulator
LSPIRVALINLPPILTQIVTEVLAKPDIRAEGTFSGAEGCEQVAALRPEVVIVGLEDDSADEDGLPPECRRLLSCHPWAKVLSLAHDGREAVLHELHPRRTVLGEASPQKLLETIRGARTQA